MRIYPSTLLVCETGLPAFWKLLTELELAEEAGSPNAGKIIDWLVGLFFEDRIDQDLQILKPFDLEVDK